ncbi:hypothetical protein KHQ82_05730 [Mycoplasmatota bacterium]|nr:hypothetical protein KHQ82_05730 [Mycoplasmatota bacterium]
MKDKAKIYFTAALLSVFVIYHFIKAYTPWPFEFDPELGNTITVYLTSGLGFIFGVEIGQLIEKNRNNK